MEHKAGFVNIIGNPNVGKSTLMNALVGENLSTITYKAQTTRHRIKGIVNGDDFQIVYSDTPGILEPAYKLHESMMQFVEGALQDADVFLLVVEIGEQNLKNESILRKLQQTETPLIVVINKIDLSNMDEVTQKVEHWQELFPKAAILPISAKEHANTDQVFKQIIDKLPIAPAYYPKDELTDKSLRFFASEIIREKIFLNYDKEIPYSTEVAITSFKEDERIAYVDAELYVSRETQKGILIGHQGKKLKKVGTESRKDIQDFIGKKVHLELFVKVKKDWRDNDRMLKQFGYTEK